MATLDNNRPAQEPAAPAEETAPGGRDISQATIATYDQIAAIYYEKWRDRSAIHRHLTRFVDMIRVYGLGALPVLDIGCGPGFDAAFFRQSGLRAVGLDLSPAMMRAGRPEFGGDYVQADMRHLPLASGVGGLWAGASLLHLPRQEVPAILRHFAGFLVPGGLLYLSLKAGQGAEWTAQSHGVPLPRYFVYWQPEALDQALRDAGFQIVDGWLSPADQAAGGQPTGWLIRFARKARPGNSFAVSQG
jgi:SAM-dependent methyltransferase